MQQTLVLLKPDTIQRGLMGEVISRLERKGLKFAGIKFMSVSQELAKMHYSEHIGKPFFDGLVSFITSSPILAMVLEGDNVIDLVRKTIGETNPATAAPGTIRGDLAVSIGMNLIHGSDSVESAEREIDLFFSQHEIITYSKDLEIWTIEA